MITRNALHLLMALYFTPEEFFAMRFETEKRNAK